MKKILALITALLMVMPTFAMADENDCDDIFNNPILTIVATLKDEPSQPAPDATLIDKSIYGTYNFDSDGYSFSEVSIYSDGSYTETFLFEQPHYRLDKATKHFPAYLEDTNGFYISYEETEEKSEYGYFEDLYLTDLRGGEITRELVGSIDSFADAETYHIVYNVYTAKMVNGEKVREKINENPLTFEEVEALKIGTSYDDGLKFGPLPADEYGFMNGYTDINGKVYFADPVATYYNYFYNLGYLVETSNNGYALDYSIDDPESQRVYTSNIKNVFTEESCCFDDTNIRSIFNSGYALVDVKDEARKETTYIAKVKSAVIKVMVDGQKVLFDVLPTIKDGRTLVPLRAIFEALNADVSWEASTQTITAKKDDKTIVLAIGSDKMLVDGEEKVLDVPASITDGRTLVPVRAISEAFGCNVSWNADDRCVNIEK